MIKKIFSLKFVRYGLSSLLAFAINYALLLVLEHSLTDIVGVFGLEIAALIGWIVSSNVNFFVNRKFVFHDSGKLASAYLKYYGVAIPVFLIKNLGLLELLVRVVHISTEIASPLAETLMFVVTYFFQKLLVFKNKGQRSIDKV